MFCIVVAVFASSIYQSVRKFEDEVSDIFGEQYSRLNAEYKNAAVFGSCLKNHDIEECADIEVVMNAVDSLTEDDRVKLFLSYDKLIHTKVDHCPSRNTHLNKRKKWTLSQDFGACLGVSLAASSIILQIPIASMMGMGVPFTVLGGTLVYVLASSILSDRRAALAQEFEAVPSVDPQSTD